MICQKCGEENNEVYGFCTKCGANLRSLPEPTGFSPPANASPMESVEHVSAPTDFSAPVSSSQMMASPAESGSETIAVPSFTSNLSNRESKGNSNKIFLAVGVALGFVFFLIVGGGVFVWWQMQRSDQQSADNQNLQVRASTNSDSNSPNLNASPNSTADDAFTRLQSRLRNAAPNEKNALDSELKSAESKYPNDYRFTYERAKLETVKSKGHHEAFEILFHAGEKAIKANRSAELLRDLKKDKNTDLKRLIDHKEWADLEKALETRDSKALGIKEH